MQIGERIALFFRSKPAPAVSPPDQEQGWSGDSMLYSRADFPKYNPDQLIGRKGFGIYKNMMTDEQVKAVVRFKRDAITSRDFHFVCDHEELSDEEREERVKFFEHCLSNMEGSFKDALNGIMSAMYNGFSMTEKVFAAAEYDGRQIHGIKALKLRPFDTFEFYVDKHGNIDRIKQKFGAEEQDIDPEKFIHFVQNPDIDDHYGGSELREAYRAWFSKDIAIRMQNIYLERMAGGFVWASPAQGRTLVSGSAEYTTLQSVLTNITTKTAIIMPSGVELKIAHPGNTDAFERAISSHDKSIAKALLVPNLMGISEQGQTGSYSQSKTQLEAFLWTLEADGGRLEEALNEQLFRDLGERNFPDGIYPRFKFKPISDTKKHELINLWKDLVGAEAVQPTEMDEAHLREMMEFPPKPQLAEDVAPTVTLNGAQIQQLVDIAAKVGKGELDAEAGVAIVVAAFPISEEDARKMLIKSEAPEPADGGMDDVEPNDDGQGGGNDPAGDKPGGEPDYPDQTVVGRGKMKEPMTAFEVAQARVDFAVIASRSVDAVEESTYSVAKANGRAIKRLVNDAETIGYDVERVADLTFTSSELSSMKKAVIAGLENGWRIGTDHAKKELRKADGSKFSRAFFIIPDRALQEVAGEFLRMRAHTITGSIAEATQKDIQSVLMNSIKNSTPWDETHANIYALLAQDGLIEEDDIPESVMDAITEKLGTLTERNTHARIGTIMQTSTFESINEARYEYFTAPELEGFVQAFEYSAIIDDATTEICEHLDGHIHAAKSDVWGKWSPPNHFNALASGSVIKTEAGPKRIEDIRIGDRALTHRGRFMPVYAVMAKESDGGKIRLLHTDAGGVLAVTDEHPVLTSAGWKRSDDLQIGDVLIQHAEDCSGFEDSSIAHPQNTPSLFDQGSVPYQIGISADSVGVVLSVDLQEDHVIDESEVRDVWADRMLEYKRRATVAEKLGHDALVMCRSSGEGTASPDCGNLADARHQHRVVVRHPGRVGSMDCAGFLAEPESPMVRTAPLVCRIGIRDLRLLDARTNRNAVALAPSAQGGLADPKAPLDGSQRLSSGDVAVCDQLLNGCFVGKVHDERSGFVKSAIVSIVEVDYSAPVWNIAVAEDESYIADGFVVHNCRSLLIPITEMDEWEESPEPTIEPQKGFTAQGADDAR